LAAKAANYFQKSARKGWERIEVLDAKARRGQEEQILNARFHALVSMLSVSRNSTAADEDGVDRIKFAQKPGEKRQEW
jgi:hypothetical protein